MKAKIRIINPHHYTFTVYDNKNRLRPMVPMHFENEDTVEIDLSSFGEIKGKWNVLIRGK